MTTDKTKSQNPTITNQPQAGPEKLSLDQLEGVTGGGIDPEDRGFYGNGNDHIVGSGESDWVESRGGNDTINGMGGNDILVGGSGHDTIDGGSGNDKVFGGSGNDELDGGSGNDKLDGGAGNDDLDGGTGNDTLIYRHGGGHDVIDGGAGNDTLNLKLEGTSAEDWYVIIDGGPNMNLAQLAEREGGLVGLEATIVAPDGGIIEFNNIETLKLA